MLHGDPPCIFVHFHFCNLSIAPGVLDFHRKFKLKPEEKERCTTGDTRLAGWIHFQKQKKHGHRCLHYQHALKKRRGFLFVLTYLWCASLRCYMFLCWGYLFTFTFHCYRGTHDDCIVHNNFERPSFCYSLKQRKNTSLPVITLLNQSCRICRNAIFHPPTEVYLRVVPSPIGPPMQTTKRKCGAKQVLP